MSDAPAFGRRPSPDPRPIPASAEPRPVGKPVWPGVFIFMIVAYLLQVLPFPGFIMMLILAPLWPVVMFNLLMIFMVADAVKGRTPRFLLAIPITVYVGTLIASGASYLEFKRMEGDILAHNAAQRVAYDPARMDLVFPAEGESLVSRYAVPVAYSYSAGGHDQPTMSQRLLPKAACDSIPRSDLSLAMRISWPSVAGKSVSNACLLHMPEAPTRPLLTVTRSEASFDGLLKGRNKDTILTPPGAPQARLRAARVEVLPPIPLPVAGCFIGPSKAGWRCQATLLRVPMTIGDWGESGAALANALGLKPRTTRPGPIVRYRPSMVFDEAQTAAMARGSEAVVAQAQGFAAAETERQLAMFRGLVEGRPVDSKTFREWTVISNADRLSGEAVGIVAALERIPPGHDGAEAKRILAHVAVALPPEAFAAISGRLLRAVMADEALAGQSTILVRLGDAGPGAGPLLLSKLQSRRGGDIPSAVQGLCRMGPMAGQGAAKQVAAAAAPELAEKHPDRDLMEAVVVTLARLGRPDLARPFVEPLRGSRRQWAQSQLASVTTASPASVCAGSRGRSRLPNVPWLKA